MFLYFQKDKDMILAKHAKMTPYHGAYESLENKLDALIYISQNMHLIIHLKRKYLHFSYF